MTAQEIRDEILRLTATYKEGEGRRRLTMAEAAQLGQPAGNAVAMPEPAQAGPDLDEFAFLGSPSPPVQSAETMIPRQGGVRSSIAMPGLLDRHTSPSLPPGFSFWDDGSIKDPDGNPATVRQPGAREIAKDVGAAAFPGAFGLARSTLLARKLPGMAPGTLAGKGVMEAIQRLQKEYESESPRLDPVDHNDFVERVRKNARPERAGAQRPVPAFIGVRG